VKKILVVGGTIFARNRGVAAITKGCVDSLRNNLTNPEITLIHTFVESFYPTKTTYLENIKIVMDSEEKLFRVFKKGIIRIFIATVWRFLSCLHINADCLLRDKVLKEFKKTEVVINLSYGDTFIYQKRFYSKVLFFILVEQSLLAILLRKPLFFFPQSIGPFCSKFSKFLAKFILDRCNIIMVREEISRDYLLKMKIMSPIQLVPDLSFLIAPASDQRILEIFSKENVQIKRPLVGIAVRENMYEHLDVISEVIDHLILKMNAGIIFIPHTSIRVFYLYDPRFLARKILKKIKAKQHINLIEGEYTVEELRGLIGKCDLFIGAYMHANTSALSMHIPTIAISYSHKTDGLMNLMGLGEFVLPLNNLNAIQLINKTEDAYRNRDRIKEVLKQKIPILQKMAMRAGEFVKNLTESTV